MARKRTERDNSKPGDKPSKQEQNRKAPQSRKGTPNTATHIYLDTFNKAKICAKDKADIEKACKEQASKDSAKNSAPKKAKSKLGAAADKVKGAVTGLDKIGKASTGYKRSSDNGWIQDHCEGMWVKPHGSNVDDFNKQINEAKDKLNDDILQAVKDAGGKIVDDAGKAAGDYAEKAAIREAAGLAALVFPVVGEVIAGGVTIYNIGDGVWTAAKTAGSAIGQAGEAMQKINALRDQIGSLDKLLSKDISPTEIWADIMTAIGEVNPCLRARKCQLVPFNKTTPKKAADTGEGCCPGQTGHHVIPDSAVGECPGYTEGDAPTICLEGADNNHGSHGAAHNTLKESMDKYNGNGTDGKINSPQPIDYEEMRKRALEAVAPFTEQCNKACLKAQLDSYFKDCKFTATSGKGGTSKNRTEAGKKT